MNTTVNSLIIGVLTFSLGLFFIFYFRKLAIKLNLVDKPNYRKVHTNPVPVIGGISIAILFLILLILPIDLSFEIKKYKVIFILAFSILILGIIDDKIDLGAKFKLGFQIILATIIAASDIRISSVYGFMGIYEIGIYWEYIITIFVITGVVNAFNLMDGVDGLVGGLSLLGFSMFAVAAIYTNNKELLFVSVFFVAALLSFLRFNFSRRQKIFMGDSGSLLLGFILITLGIELLESKLVDNNLFFGYIFILLVSFFSIPVLDSIRVYLGRIKKGKSPLKADKSHVHHLLLRAGLTHKKISLYVVAMSMFFFFISFGLNSYLSVSMIVLALIFVFYIIIKVLTTINDIKYWREKIHELENN